MSEMSDFRIGECNIQSNPGVFYSPKKYKKVLKKTQRTTTLKPVYIDGGT